MKYKVKFCLMALLSSCLMQAVEDIASRPHVGVGVLIIQDHKILLGIRKSSHGIGMWAPPGGHMEFGESFEECAAREVLEETGLVIKNPLFYDLTNDIFEKEHKHYITIFVMVHEFEGEVELREPDICAGWEWIDINALPENLFLTLKNLLLKHSLE